MIDGFNFYFAVEAEEEDQVDAVQFLLVLNLITKLVSLFWIKSFVARYLITSLMFFRIAYFQVFI